MFKIFYAEKDATLYESVPDLNTGVDEILEIGKRLGNSGNEFLRSRSVIKFDINEIENTLSKYSISLDSCKFILQLYTSHAKFLPSSYTIDANILYDNWSNGTGFENSSPSVLDGVSWNYPSLSNTWTTSGQITNSIMITGSTGGSWLYQSSSGQYNLTTYNQSFYTQPGITQSEIFTFRPTDINLDVTNAIKLWINGINNVSIENNGFILKLSDSDENSNSGGYIRFFSRETHTIYVPKITMYWDDSSYDTQLNEINEDSYSVYMNIKNSYKDTEISKIRIYGRDKYPQKTGTNLFPVQNVKRLPDTTFYSILDAATNETIIPFDNIYTKVSCDNTSNFIHIDMNGFMPERYYRIALKIINGYQEQYIDNSHFFKVVR